jgi:hypothetical protein
VLHCDVKNEATVVAKVQKALQETTADPTSAPRQTILEAWEVNAGAASGIASFAPTFGVGRAVAAGSAICVVYSVVQTEAGFQGYEPVRSAAPRGHEHGYADIHVLQGTADRPVSN